MERQVIEQLVGALDVEGRLDYRSFADEEGKERGVVEIVASDVQFLGRPRSEANTSGPTPTEPAHDDGSADDLPG